ncbi:hypothetical protein BABINDRAFT_30462 [Babjeviella inositovora NRRL Y-12698]|uniref:Amino-acid acetyltransferase, mitochondrial n=1 Tax=Babjeviella inositovora NRRL Y-12698 TaxID=984486 RepID=A0A1E3QZ16_9ASCO|nr:uncharacterized protein BABINDRAFT_30462 [Babjeviella inositovora NRRL Y-12698]ODQ82878.1 hypothetical protein BABINDRAFT_30462 [Babjeviella inositovora NRRL Y-12698]
MSHQLRQIAKQFTSNLAKHENRTNEKRNLIRSILKSTATKREARNYLNKYSFRNEHTENGARERFVELLLLTYKQLVAEKAIKVDSLVERGTSSLYVKNTDNVQPLRVVIIKIRDLTKIPTADLNAVSQTVARMVRLGISPVLIIDSANHVKKSHTFGNIERAVFEKSNRLSNSIEKNDPEMNVMILRSLFERRGTALELTFPELILNPLVQGAIPVVLPIVYDEASNTDTIASPDEILQSLASSLYALNEDLKSVQISGTDKNNRDVLTVEKIIMIDPLGGIPSVERSNSSHVYINLAQELDEIMSELHIGFIPPQVRDHHLANLKTMAAVLHGFPGSKVAGIITAPDVFNAGKIAERVNPVIYNILTERPIISPSLPINGKVPKLKTSVLRRGIPLAIFEADDSPELVKGLDLVKLDKLGAISLKKLKVLIDDSFQRELDMDHYLKRTNKNVAALIIAGDYEGAAIITYETSSKLLDRHGEPQKVAYLDKFAVSSSSQGSTGVADVIFKAMARLFPEELIWRSRSSNPVNKWYFERSCGTFSNEAIDLHWKIFWVGSRTREMDHLDAYEDICFKIQPSFNSPE